MDNNEQPLNGAFFYMASNLFIVAFVLINLFFIVSMTTDVFADVLEAGESFQASSLFDPEMH